jgi:hypothetical protein
MTIHWVTPELVFCAHVTISCQCIRLRVGVLRADVGVGNIRVRRD